MTSTIRSILAGGLVFSACMLSTPGAATAQGKSHKGEVKTHKVDKKVHKTVSKKTNTTPRRTVYRSGSYRTGYVLCNDGVWVPRSTRTCSSHDGIATRQGNFPPASDRARERANENSAVVRGIHNTTRSGAIARCNDGTYWHSNTRTGACYRHGGVATWL